MNIKLPPLFESKLQGNDREKGIVFTALSSFGSWYASSGTPPFFRDYTNHGTKHVTNVLATAAAMIPSEAAKVFSAADVTIFVLATLLHDSALHLAEPGFHQLIIGDARDRRIEAFDVLSWPTLWDEFLFTARRWNDETLTSIFGEEFVRLGHSVSNPFGRWDNLTLADYKLIGEFIRCHHHRLAHEFAIFGVPGNQARFLNLPTDVSEEWKDLVGITARSHGLPLRTCLNHVDKHYQIRDYQGVHAVYLMALLRLADYLQIDSARAPEIVFGYRVLPSHISELEWRVHHAVKNITPEHEDPESVEIRAEPPDVETYLRLREWLDNIQNELDISWAVLGEVYGRYPSLKKLGLHWRRVRSNLDDLAAFARTVTYLPRRIRIEVARAELLSLLIRPLYGDDPSFGVREMMQNAVDAVREREYFQQQYPEFAEVGLRNQEADVVIWLSDFDSKANCAWMEFSDRGIGMTEKVVTDYFLTAGASYRHSDHWQRTFECCDLPASPNLPRAQVIRSGRFGVGALAAFLLGEAIEVETRHITSSTGFRFKMFLSQEVVQIECVNDLSIGTKIRVCVSPKAFKALNKVTRNSTVFRPGQWDWYVLNKPTVLRISGKEKQELERPIIANLEDWRIAETDLPLTVHWTWRTPDESNFPSLSCNGIFVSKSQKLPVIKSAHCGNFRHYVQTPLLHITDPDGYLALGLTRKEVVSDEYGFESDLYESIMKDYFARLLAQFPETLATNQIKAIWKGGHFISPSYYSQNIAIPDILFSRDGFCLAFNRAITSGGRAFKRLLWMDSTDALALVPDLSLWDCVVLEGTWDLSLMNKTKVRYSSDDISSQFNLKDGELMIDQFRLTDDKTYSPNVEDKPEGLPGFTEKNIEWTATHKKRVTEKKITRWLIESDRMPASKYPFESLIKIENNQFDIPFVAELILATPWRTTISADLLDYWWQRFFGEEWIPWGIAERHVKFPEAFKELAPYIARYEK